MELNQTPDRAAAPQREPGSQPRLLDYLCLLLGVGASLWLADMTGLRTRWPEQTPGPALEALLNVLPALLFLPLGVILCWPIFSATQWLTGRRQGLTAGEWLLGFAWLGALAFAGWCIGKGTGILPDFLTDDEFKKYAILGYILFMLSMGTLALAIWLIGLVARWPQPWTHTLSLALMIWPALPLLVIWLGKIKME